MKGKLSKRIFGAIYGIFFEHLFDRIQRLQNKIEKKCLGYCVRGCENCYKWNGYCRSHGETPYKKFRRKHYKGE